MMDIYGEAKLIRHWVTVHFTGKVEMIDTLGSTKWRLGGLYFLSRLFMRIIDEPFRVLRDQVVGVYGM